MDYLAQVVGPVMAATVAVVAALCIFANEYFKGGDQPAENGSDD